MKSITIFRLQVQVQRKLPLWLISVMKVYEVCSNNIRIGIVVAVHWVGCDCNQS